MPVDEEMYADKISKLLRKAESTTPQEAEALVAKAQVLMTKYAISEDLLARAQGSNLEQREEIIQVEIFHTGSYKAALYDVCSVIAEVNDCKPLVRNALYLRPAATVCIVIGHESDVARVKMLNASLQIQATGALTKWAKANIEGWMTPSQKYKERREFLFGFARGLKTQLDEAAERGRKEAATDEQVRASVSEEDATDSVALIVKGKKVRVAEWIDNTYGQLRSVPRRHSPGSITSCAAGIDAGKSADVSGGSGKISGKSKELTA